LGHQREFKFQAIIDFIRGIYGEGNILLHRPVFEGKEKEFLIECIDSNFVSSVGARVTEFEQQIAAFTGTGNGVATVNGTAALHIALQLVGVQRNDEVITQALSFIATCNAITYTGADPVFVDVDLDTLGLSPESLRLFLINHAVMRQGAAFNKTTGRRLAACVPMHTFGHPCRIQEIVSICNEFNIPVVEDAAESLGSFVDGKHTGTFGKLATLSFNGNKVITTGGGGMIITDDPALASRAKHLTTTAKRPHPYEFFHDEVGYNYRLPNLNAALGCAQMELLPHFLSIKAMIAQQYREFFSTEGTPFITSREGSTANYWLNAILMNSKQDRDDFLEYTNSRGVMTRPIWRLMPHLPMFSRCQQDALANAKWLEERLVNLPSSVPDGALSVLNHGVS